MANTFGQRCSIKLPQFVICTLFTNFCNKFSNQFCVYLSSFFYCCLLFSYLRIRMSDIFHVLLNFIIIFIITTTMSSNKTFFKNDKTKRYYIDIYQAYSKFANRNFHRNKLLAKWTSILGKMQFTINNIECQVLRDFLL